MLLIDFPMLLADKNATFWFPPAASTFAADIDWLYMVILYISIFFFVLVVGAMVLFAIKYRRRPGYEGDSRPLHNNALEITWTVIPSLIVCWIFAEGVNGYMDMMRPPVDTIDINVTARQWDWSFQYPNGAISDQLHIPNNRAILLNMRSEDVLHAFYVPAFRVKSDVVPGRVTTMWFQPILEGEFDLFCAEYCGTDHSRMRGKVVVQTPEEFARWLEDENVESMAQRGRRHVEALGCLKCHGQTQASSATQVQIGPPLTGLYGSRVPLSDGEFVQADDSYIRRALLDPRSQTRAGFAGVMPSYDGQLDPQQIMEITAYIRSIADATGPLAGPGTPLDQREEQAP